MVGRYDKILTSQSSKEFLQHGSWYIGLLTKNKIKKFNTEGRNKFSDFCLVACRLIMWCYHVGSEATLFSLSPIQKSGDHTHTHTLLMPCDFGFLLTHKTQTHEFTGQSSSRWSRHATKAEVTATRSACPVSFSLSVKVFPYLCLVETLF